MKFFLLDLIKFCVTEIENKTTRQRKLDIYNFARRETQGYNIQGWMQQIDYNKYEMVPQSGPMTGPTWSHNEPHDGPNDGPKMCPTMLVYLCPGHLPGQIVLFSSKK